MENAIIRWANPKDSKALALIHTAGWQAAYKGIIPDEILDNISVEKRSKYFEAALTEGRDETALIEVDTITAGFLTLGHNRDEDLDNTYGEIWGLYLLPQYWDRGIGRRLMEWGTQELINRGYKYATLWVLVDNNRGKNFYFKLGFLQESKVKEIQIGKLLKEERLIKELLL